MNTRKYDDEIELCRSDLGDGGWSLHAHRVDLASDPDADEADLWPILLSGESDLDDDGKWSRPNKDDYAEAHRKLAEMRTTEGTER